MSNDETTDGSVPPVAAASLSFGNAVGRISLCVRDGVAHFTITGDPAGKDIHSCIRSALDSGIMWLPMPVLVDMTRFSGSIDWSSIHAVAEMTVPYMRADPPSRVAYLTPDCWFAALIKLVGYIFTKSQHRLFASQEKAQEWLQLNAASPEAS